MGYLYLFYLNPIPSLHSNARVLLKLNSTTRTRHGPDTDKDRARCRVRAKFHYTDPHGPNGVSPQKKSVRVRAGPVGSVSGPYRVRVVEFSYYRARCVGELGLRNCIPVNFALDAAKLSKPPTQGRSLLWRIAVRSVRCGTEKSRSKTSCFKR